MWAVVIVFGVCGAVAATNGRRFERRVAREVGAMGGSLDAVPLDPRSRAELPTPVQRYPNKALGIRNAPFERFSYSTAAPCGPRSTARMAIRGEQHFTAVPPGFIWWGRVRLLPGVGIDARDRSVNGVGHMFVTMESTFTIADRRGPQMGQGALVRLLCEMTWLPTALLDNRYVQWSGVDERHARANLTVNGRTATAVLEFGSDDLPETFSADRCHDDGGTAVLTSWVGRISDYRAVDGVLVPRRVVAAWVIDGRPIGYVRFDVQQVEFDGRGPS